MITTNLTYTAITQDVIVAIEAAGHTLTQIDNVLVVSDEAAVQAIINSVDVMALEKAKKISEVKLQANKLILAIIPDWKQSNFNARMNELNAISAGNHPVITQRALTITEQAEINSMFSVFQSVEVIRQISDNKEAEINALITYSQVVLYDTSAGW